MVSAIVNQVFEAIADPTRRQILGYIQESGPLSVNEVAEPFSISRQAVTKHLDVLSRAGLVHVERSGRHRLHHVDPAPLRAVAEWLEPYSAAWDERLARLEKFLDDHPEG